jgi:hypothetical protein
MSAVLGARIGCPFASIHGLSLPLLSKPAGRPMMTACTRVAARLWLPLLKALGLLVVLLHACWHGAFKADIFLESALTMQIWCNLLPSRCNSSAQLSAGDRQQKPAADKA